MTVEGGASSVGAPADEDAFEKQMRHSHEATTEQLRVSTVPRYVKPQALDQLEEWMKEKPILTSLMTSSVRKESFIMNRSSFNHKLFMFIDKRLFIMNQSINEAKGNIKPIYECRCNEKL
jgi:hypothetical protein